jgi:hypothetical protein
MGIEAEEISGVERTFFTLYPDTIEEAALLLRFSARIKKEKPVVRTSFYGKTIYTDITFNHRTDSKVPRSDIGD